MAYLGRYLTESVDSRKIGSVPTYVVLIFNGFLYS